MAKLKVFEYAKCSTCRKAVKFLEKNRIAFERVPIVENPPTRAELKRMLAFVGGDVRRLFNTSGQSYRAGKLGAKLPGLTEAQALKLLAADGKLIRRPFVCSDSVGLVGFDEAAWKQALS